VKSPAGGALRAGAIQLLAVLVWLLPLAVRPTGIPFWRGGEFSDLLISHWPNAWFIRRSLTTWGQLPLWNPLILAGAPFAADPLSGMWYPPNWLAVSFPQPLTFNVLSWLHLAWGGAGVWLLLRRMGVAPHAALFGSLAFSGMPKLAGHVGLGHLGLVGAVSWTPWVAGAAVLAGRLDGGNLRHAALLGGLLGLVFLADPRWAGPLGLITVAVFIGGNAHSHERDRVNGASGKGSDAPAGGGRGQRKPTGGASESDQALSGGRGRWSSGRRGLIRVWESRPGRIATRAAVALLCALGVAAVLGLPLLEFLELSTRADLAEPEGSALSLPIPRALGLLVPDLGGWPEWQSYFGIAVAVLAILALSGRVRGSRFWAGLGLGCLLLALGDQTPLHAVLTRILPGYAWLRVPARWLFGTGFALSVLAALGLDRLVSDPLDGRQRARFNLGVFGLLLLVLGLGLARWFLDPRVTLDRLLPFGLSAAWLGIAWLWTHPRLRSRLPAHWMALGWIALLALDLALADFSQIESRPPSSAQNATVAELDSRLTDGVAERAFSPSYSLSQPAAAMAGLELVDGVNPLQLRALRDEAAAATGFDPAVYSVTLPPFPEGDPRRPWAVRPDPERLGRLNVGYLVSAYPLEQEGWTYAGVAGGEYLYRNALTRPRAWVELSDEDGAWRPVNRLEWSPNRIVIEAEGPGRLVLSEMSYPGWEVRVNRLPVEFAAGSEPLRAVELPAGSVRVELEFRPWTVFAGAAATSVTLAILAALWLVRA
jgi:hypothetical protein